MRILLSCSLGGSGHLQPLLPFARAAEARGDEVRVVGPAALGEQVAAAGLAFHAGGEPDESEVAPIRERLPVVPAAEATVLGNRDLFGRLAARALLPAVRACVRSWRPDLVLREPCEYASAVVAGERGLPVAQVAISSGAGEVASLAAAAPALEEHRLGLTDALLAQRYLSRFPASLDPPVFATTLRYREAVPAAPRPLPEWWAGSTDPLVYVTFGTVLGHLTVAPTVLRSALDAVAGLTDVRVLVTVGRSVDPEVLGPVPAHVHVERWVDQADVLAVAAAVLCHGGSGTVLGTLAAGVPLVAVPLFADQFANARAVAAAGAGLAVEDGPAADGRPRRVVGRSDAPRITGALRTVLGADRFRRAAVAVADEMAAAPAAGELLDRLAG